MESLHLTIHSSLEDPSDFSYTLTENEKNFIAQNVSSRIDNSVYSEKTFSIALKSVLYYSVKPKPYNLNFTVGRRIDSLVSTSEDLTLTMGIYFTNYDVLKKLYERLLTFFKSKNEWRKLGMPKVSVDKLNRTLLELPKNAFITFKEPRILDGIFQNFTVENRHRDEVQSLSVNGSTRIVHKNDIAWIKISSGIPPAKLLSIIPIKYNNGYSYFESNLNPINFTFDQDTLFFSFLNIDGEKLRIFQNTDSLGASIFMPTVLNLVIMTNPVSNILKI